jgi:hypothetical protein
MLVECKRCGEDSPVATLWLDPVYGVICTPCYLRSATGETYVPEIDIDEALYSVERASRSGKS